MVKGRSCQGAKDAVQVQRNIRGNFHDLCSQCAPLRNFAEKTHFLVSNRLRVRGEGQVTRIPGSWHGWTAYTGARRFVAKPSHKPVGLHGERKEEVGSSDICQKAMLGGFG